MATNTPTSSTGTGVVGVEIVGQMRGYLAGLVETGKLTKEQTQGMARDFSLMAKQVMNAQKAIVRGTKETSDAQRTLQLHMARLKAGVVDLDSAGQRAGGSMGNLARQLGDVGTMAAMGQAPMQILASQGEQLFFALREAGGATKVLTVASDALFTMVAGVGLATVGALGAAYVALGRDAALAKENQASLAAAMEYTADAGDRATSSALKAAAARGQIAETDAAIQEATNSAIDRQNKALQEHVDRLEAAQIASKSYTTQMVDLGTQVRGVGILVSALGTTSEDYQKTIATETQAIDSIRAATRAEIAAKSDEIVAEQEAKDAKKAATAARKDHTKVIREEEAALRALSAAMQRENDTAAQVAADYQSTISALYAISDASQQAAADEIHRIDIAERAAKAEAEMLYRKARDSGGVSGREEAERAYQEAVTSIEAEAETKRAELRDKARKKEAEEQKKAIDLQMRLADQAFGMVEDIAGKVSAGMGDAYAAATDNLAQMEAYQNAVESHLTDTQKEELAQRVKAQKDAARRAFETYKAAQLAQAGIGALSAFVAALDDAPYPANLAIAALSAGAAAAPIAAIAAEQPSFHSGGAIGNMAPDEVSIRAQAGEFVASKQGRSILGDGVLQQANAGVTPDAGGVYLVNAYRHTRETSRYEADRLARNGPYARAIRGSSLPGMR